MQENCCMPNAVPGKAAAGSSEAASASSVYERALVWSPCINFASSAADQRLIAADAARYGLRVYNGSLIAVLYVNTDGSAANGLGIPIQPGTGMSFTGADCSIGEIHVALQNGAANSIGFFQIGRRA